MKEFKCYCFLTAKPHAVNNSTLVRLWFLTTVPKNECFNKGHSGVIASELLMRCNLKSLYWFSQAILF